MDIKYLAALLILGLFAGSSFAGSSFAGDNPEARRIMEMVLDRDDGDNCIEKMEMILIDKRGRERVRKIKMFTKDYGRDTYSIRFFLEPAEVRNTALLAYDYRDEAKDDDQWLYLPALKQVKRIASKDKSGSFMGSDFNYSDMTKRNLKDFDFTLLKEAEVNGVKCWAIQAIPRSKEVVDETGYTKSLFLIRQDNYVSIRGIHWLQTSSKKRFFEVTKLEQIDGIWVRMEMRMKTRRGNRTEHETIIRRSDVRFNQKLKDSFFAAHQLSKGAP